MIPLSFKGLVDNLTLLGGGPQALVATSASPAVKMALQFMGMFVGFKLLQVRPNVIETDQKPPGDWLTLIIAKTRRKPQPCSFNH
jgi:hypothetical protein